MQCLKWMNRIKIYFIHWLAFICRERNERRFCEEEWGITKRCSEANNKYMKCYVDKKPNKCITYFLANNVYGLAMSQYLPCGGIKLLNLKWLNKFYLNIIGENSFIGYITDVDIGYPNEFNKLHSDYPLPPEKLEISYNMLWNYCSSIENEYGIKIWGVDKLVQNLGNKFFICSWVVFVIRNEID